MRGKGVFLFVLVCLFLVGCVSALNSNLSLKSSYYVNITGNSFVNVSIGAENMNITQVVFILQSDFVNDTNGTSASGAFFTNTSVSGYKILTFTNTTSPGIVINGTTQVFWFQLSRLGIGGFRIGVNATGTDGSTNYSTFTIMVNFPFSGYVKNETGDYQNGTNITLYQFVEGENGPPSQILIDSALTNANGSFNFASVNVSIDMLLIKIVQYNQTGSAVKVGTVLPAFPASLFYPSGQLGGRDMTLNGTTFYIQPAATLRLYAHNTTDTKRFGYEVIDQKVGFPVESSVFANTTSATVIVPSGRDYSVMIIGENMPPISNFSLGSVNEGSVITINQSLVINTFNLFGCINVADKNNNTLLNVTNIKLSIVPFVTSSGMFIPPVDADMGADLTNKNQLNNSDARCPLGLAWYNLSVIGSTSGMNYFIEAYAKNASLESESPGNANNLGALGNKSITNHTNLNLTLYRLAGSYWSGSLGSLNTSQMKINIINESGSPITTNMHIEIGVKNLASGAGSVHYMIESTTNGTIYLPILNNSNWAKISVFPNNAPPMQKMLNLSSSENNITLVSVDFASGGDKGLREMNATGDLVRINASTMPIQLRFLRRGTNQVITSMDGGDFNPLKALVAGSVDLEIKVTATNVSMRFNNFDMFSAKQPPMFAVMDNKTLASSSSQNWRFGNFVPKDVYDNVSITIPYSSSVNESYTYNMSIPVLYSESMQRTNQFSVAWNYSVDGINNLTDEFIAYNNSRYRSYLAPGGVQCSDSNSSSVCYMNETADTIRMEIPHFSGVSPTIAGVAPASSGDNDDSGSSSSSGGGSTISEWTNTYMPSETNLENGYTKELRAKDRVRVDVDGETHYVGITKIKNESVTINVSSTPQQAVFVVGDVRKFEVTDDDYYDIRVKLNGINITLNKANITINSIHEKIKISLNENKNESIEGLGGQIGKLLENETSKKWILIVVGIIIVLVGFYLIKMFVLPYFERKKVLRGF